MVPPRIELNVTFAGAAVNRELENEIGLAPRCGDDDVADDA